jgi:hypothetical protein
MWHYSMCRHYPMCRLGVFPCGIIPCVAVIPCAALFSYPDAVFTTPSDL